MENIMLPEGLLMRPEGCIMLPGGCCRRKVEAKSREISWKGFVNDYLAHGIVEKLTLVNHEWVEFKMTNDSSEQVDNVV